MEKNWLKSYPKNIPENIQIRHSSIIEAFKACIQKYKYQTAFESYGCKMSFKEWEEKSSDWSFYLKNFCHLKKGDRIAIQIPNTLQFPIAVIGALKAGLTVVNINPSYTEHELNEILKDSSPQAILIFSHSAHKLNVKIPHIIVTDLEDLFPFFKRYFFHFVIHFVKKLVKPYNLRHTSFRKALKQGTSYKNEQKTSISLDDLAFLQYTGGTTGTPKGAMLSHRNILSNYEQCFAWMSPFLTPGKETCITALPLYHIFALQLNLFLLPFYGCRSILITDPRDTKNFIKILKKNKWSVFVGVNALFKLLLKQKDFSQIDFSFLKVSVGGGASIEKPVYEQWLTVTGNSIVEGYGLTEASPVVSCNILNKPIQGSCGLPLPSTQVRIVNRKEDEGGPIGELEVKGPQVMQGYWKGVEKNILNPEGWLKTGDIAQINKEGFMTLLDRKKDMILVSGFNVYPSEIENILLKHPQVKEAAVVGVFDEYSSEVPKAFIVKKAPHAKLKEKELIDFCKTYLTAYKIPKYIKFVESLPLSYVGKVLKRKLTSSS